MARDEQVYRDAEDGVLCGHAVWMDDADDLAGRVRSFLCG
jgi:hypothetical protein